MNEVIISDLQFDTIKASEIRKTDINGPLEVLKLKLVTDAIQLLKTYLGGFKKRKDYL